MAGRDRIGIAYQYRQIILFRDSGGRQGAKGAGHAGKDKAFEGSEFERVALVGNARPRLLTVGF